jgi:hypothetical protein
VVLSLIEDPELAFVGTSVTLLEKEQKGLGFAWHHLPICDMDAPDERFERV